jgi:preprotein translocase subunit SecG
MEPFAGLLLWMGDVFGVKWIRKEPNRLKKFARWLTFLFLGVFLLMLFFVITY